jgi:hypothetical protein
MRSRPRVDSTPARRHPFAFRLSVSIGWLVVVGTFFALGYLLAGHDTEQAAARIQSLQMERDRLTEALAAEREAQVRLQRSHLIDREANRAAQHQLASLQQERLRLAKQVTYLQGLLREGGKGVIEVGDFVLGAGTGDGRYDYQFIAHQLVPEFGKSTGTAVVKLKLEEGDAARVVPVEELPESGPGRHPMSFEHFQSFSGTIRLPTDAEPREIVIDILPADDNLLGSSYAFSWRPGGDTAQLPDPAVTDEGATP